MPVKAGFTYQQWNWTLADIQAYGFSLTVGAIRVPSDGKTHLTFELLESDNPSLSIPFSERTGREITIDWGDGTSGIYTTSPATHTYAAGGRYVVRADANDYFRPYQLTSLTAVSLIKADLGTRFAMNDPVFNSYYSLEEVSIPQNVTYIDSAAFQYCCSLRGVTLPSPFGEVSNSAFNVCPSLQCVSLPKNTGTIVSLLKLPLLHRKKNPYVTIV